MDLRTAVRLIAILVLAGCTLSCAASGTSAATNRLQPCGSRQGLPDALCGTLEVYEDREAAGGRRIGLNIVVLPATGGDAAPDPLFFLAGGPGQGAAAMAADVREIFRPILRARDIVLVDQRGTGRSHPLNCRSDDDSLRAATEPEEVGLDRLRRCLASYDADVRQYTTPIAMDDLDDVRAYLGYERINLYGGSYGTRAALVYLRQHGDRVRSVVLDGVAPTDMRLPLFTARDAQRALDRLLTDCEADAPCRGRFPGLATRIRALMTRLDEHPPTVRVAHPRTGAIEDVRVDARLVARVLFGALYSPVTASLVPALVERAERNEFAGLFALGVAGEQAGENMSVGMQLSVLCSEDAQHVRPDEVARESSGSVFGTFLLAGQLKACAIWPTGAIADSYYEPVTSDVPVLVLSGDLDPVTPPNWGNEVAKHLGRARHVVVPGTAHGVIATPCGARLVREFLARGDATGLDVECAAAVERPPFFVTPAGPDPAATRPAAAR